MSIGLALIIVGVGGITSLLIRLAVQSRHRALQTQQVTSREQLWKERMELLQRTQSPGAPPPPSFGERSSKQSN